MPQDDGRADLETLAILADAVDGLYRAGHVSLKTFSTALTRALHSGDPEAIGFAARSFMGLDEETRHDIARSAVESAFRRVQAHTAKRGQR